MILGCFCVKLDDIERSFAALVVSSCTAMLCSG